MTPVSRGRGRTVLRTARLRLREMTEADAEFMVALLNDADFLRYIGDRGVRTADEARAYLREGAIASYRQHGYGMYLAERIEDAAAIGVCGLVRREGLDAPDLGFALLPGFRRAGYAAEAARAVLDFATTELGIARIVAIATPGNCASIALLGQLAMRPAGTVRLPGGDAELNLYEYRASEDAA